MKKCWEFIPQSAMPILPRCGPLSPLGIDRFKSSGKELIDIKLSKMQFI